MQVNCAPDAVLTVSKNQMHAKGTCNACDEMRKRGTPTALYDISISGGYEGLLEVGIEVGKANNGKNLSIWHCKGNHVEKVNVTAKNGLVSANFSSLSPFAVYGGSTNTSPQTGDDINIGAMFALLAAALLIGTFAAWTLIKKRKGSAKK